MCRIYSKGPVYCFLRAGLQEEPLRSADHTSHWSYIRREYNTYVIVRMTKVRYVLDRTYDESMLCTSDSYRRNRWRESRLDSQTDKSIVLNKHRTHVSLIAVLNLVQTYKTTWTKKDAHLSRRGQMADGFSCSMQRVFFFCVLPKTRRK